MPQHKKSMTSKGSCKVVRAANYMFLAVEGSRPGVRGRRSGTGTHNFSFPSATCHASNGPPEPLCPAQENITFVLRISNAA